jgi:hypothetical protein
LPFGKAPAEARKKPAETLSRRQGSPYQPGVALTPAGLWRKGHQQLMITGDHHKGSDPQSNSVPNQGGSHMTRTFANRRAAGFVAAALALGVAAPTACARPFDLNSAGSYVQVGPRQSQPNAPANAGGGISDVGIVAIGTGAATLALVGVGGTRAASRRRQRQRTAPQSTIAA